LGGRLPPAFHRFGSRARCTAGGGSLPLAPLARNHRASKIERERFELMKKLISAAIAATMAVSLISPFSASGAEPALGAEPAPALEEPVAETQDVTVEFYYNYDGAPAERPASFTKTAAGGRLDSFPAEQTLPQVGARPDYGFAGWYRNPEGTGEKATADTLFAKDTSLYAKWEQVPSLYREYEDYFLMGTFGDYNNGAQQNKHYNVLCPSNSFKLTSQINTNAMRNNFVAERAGILADETLSDGEKAAQLQLANEQIVLVSNIPSINVLNNLRNWNEAHPDDKKYTRFHVVAWHGGQQPYQFFTNGFVNANYATGMARSQDLWDADQDGAFTTRETMKARLDNYIRLLMEKYEPYKDVIVSWDIVNEPVDDFTGQIRNGSDANSQPGQWGMVWHDKNPAKNADGSPKFTKAADETGLIDDAARLFDESEWIRVAFESAAKWSKENGCDWGLYLNDYMDSNKLYTKLQPTLDVTKSIRDNVDMQGIKLGWGMQGRLAWAYPTMDMLRKQVEDGLAICDEMAVSEGDIRSDFEPNPFYDPTQRTRGVLATDTPKWTANDLGSGSGSTVNPTSGTLTNTFDTHNSPVRRIPEWGVGAGMLTTGASPSFPSERYGASGYLSISESIMKKQADFAADWMDILIDHADKVELFQWDGTTDSNTFNSSKGAHLWVSLTAQNSTGRPTGVYEKYSFFAVIGAPARDKLRKAVAAGPGAAGAGGYSSQSWDAYAKALGEAERLAGERIYTLEGVNDVKDATAALYAAADDLQAGTFSVTYNANGGTGTVPVDGSLYAPGESYTVLPGTGLARDGYMFRGWLTGASNGNQRDPGKSIPITANVTLYAWWQSTTGNIPAPLVDWSAPRLDRAAFMTEIGDSTRIGLINADEAAEWGTSDASVATVDSDGLVTAVGKGDARITAAVPGYAANLACTVTVGYGAQNPFIPQSWELYIPDGEPHVFDGVMYVYGSRDINGGSCSNNYHTIYTEDGVHWTDAGYSFTTMDLPDPFRRFVTVLWAPDCVYSPQDEKYYLFSCGNDNNGEYFVAESGSPVGPFTNARQITYKNGLADGMRIGNIDPGAFVDDDGTMWLAMAGVDGQQRNYYNTLGPSRFRYGVFDAATATVDANSIIDVHDFMTQGGTLPFEGPALQKFGDYYYLIYVSDYKNPKPAGLGLRTDVQPSMFDYLYTKDIRDPDGWIYGGTILNPSLFPAIVNTHGSIEAFKGGYYAIYHNPMTQAGQRRARIERVEIDSQSGVISPIELTSSGVRPAFGVGERVNFFTAVDFSNGRWGSSPFATQTVNGFSQMYLNLSAANQHVGYRYVDLGAKASFVTLRARTSNADARLYLANGKPGEESTATLAEIALPDTGNAWREITVPITNPAAARGVKAIYFTLGAGSAALDWFEFSDEAVFSLSDDGRTVTADVANLGESSALALVLSIASYDADGRLAEVKTMDSLAVPASFWASASLAFENDTAGKTVKAFLWHKGSLAPYVGATRLK
jgi:uncharacterized repeat protein (TIGR02543 family)